jgi:thymidylate kinase
MRSDYSKFILFEGMDFSGKSTVLQKIKNLDSAWNTQHIGLCQNKTMYTLANYVNKNCPTWSKKEIGYLYLAGLTLDINLFTEPKEPTLQDSCVLLRCLAHHTAYGNKRIVQKLEALADIHPKFSKAFVFTVHIKERLSRLEKRIIENPNKINASDLLIKTDQSLFLKMDKSIKKYAKKYFNAETIDTTGIQIETTVDFLYSKIL